MLVCPRRTAIRAVPERPGASVAHSMERAQYPVSAAGPRSVASAGLSRRDRAAARRSIPAVRRRVADDRSSRIDASVPAGDRQRRLRLACTTRDRWSCIRRDNSTRRGYALPVAADPRFWGGGESQVLSLAAAVPADLPQGTYEMLFNLPDSDSRGRPDYSIRLANEGVWEPTTGYNNLLASVTIESAQPGCSAPPAAPTGLAGNVANGVASVVWSPPSGAAS